MRAAAMLSSALLVLGLIAAVPAGASEASLNMTLVDNIDYDDVYGGEGSDSEFIEMLVPQEDGTSALRTVGVFGSLYGGARILDVTDGIPVELGFYDCKIGQGDVQVFQRDEARGQATYFTFTDDNYGNEGGVCQTWAAENGKFARGRGGTFIVDITDPANPTSVQFVPFEQGSHNMTVHPSGNFLYNSNSDLVIEDAVEPAIEIWDITDLTDPIELEPLALSPRPGLGTESHDITFNEEGTRAYSAAVSQIVIIDTTDPANPSVISSTVDPMIQVAHQADPVTINDPIYGEHDFLIVEDEFAGATGAEQACPSGGTHVYDITGDLEATPLKVGAWFIDDVDNTNATGNLTPCTAHVFDIHEDAAIMTMSFYGGGSRVIDLSSLVGVSLGAQGVGMKEIGYGYTDDTNSWSFKTPEVTVAEDGTISFFGYSNDMARGIDTYRFEGTRAASGNGRWVSAADLADLALPQVAPRDYRPICLLRGLEAATPGVYTRPAGI